MKKMTSLLVFFLILLLTACGTTEPIPEPLGQEAYHEPQDTPGVSYEAPTVAPSTPDRTAPPEVEYSYDYLTFEEALQEFATDVVIAQYVGHRPFGQTLTEFEFVVQERILGNAADRIFVYTRTTNVAVTEVDVDFRPGDLTFRSGVDYLLPLRAVGSPYLNTHEDGFVFVRSIVVDLNNPSNSAMQGEPLYLHSESLDFTRSTSRQEIISHVAEKTRNNPPGGEIIRSELMEDIIHGSPYVWLVEINAPLRLSTEQTVTDWGLTDIYYVTVLEVLKGDRDASDFEPGHEIVREEYTHIGLGTVVIFHADTVFPGERHIVALAERRDGASWYSFSSRNSLFRMEQLDEIRTILRRG